MTRAPVVPIPLEAVPTISRLLTAVADEREFDSLIPHLDELLRALPDDGQSRANVEMATRRAHGVVRRLRNRERELSALYATAGEIAMHPDIDEALSAIISRARQLLGADVTYLMLVD